MAALTSLAITAAGTSPAPVAVAASDTIAGAQAISRELLVEYAKQFQAPDIAELALFDQPLVRPAG